MPAQKGDFQQEPFSCPLVMATTHFKDIILYNINPFTILVQYCPFVKSEKLSYFERKKKGNCRWKVYEFYTFDFSTLTTYQKNKIDTRYGTQQNDNVGSKYGKERVQ